MSQAKSNVETGDSAWKSLYKVGGAAATTDAQKSMVTAAGQAMLSVGILGFVLLLIFEIEIFVSK